MSHVREMSQLIPGTVEPGSMSSVAHQPGKQTQPSFVLTELQQYQLLFQFNDSLTYYCIINLGDRLSFNQHWLVDTAR